MDAIFCRLVTGPQVGTSNRQGRAFTVKEPQDYAKTTASGEMETTFKRRPAEMLPPQRDRMP